MRPGRTRYGGRSDVLGADGHVERLAERHHRCAPARLSFRAGGAGGFLDVASRLESCDLRRSCHNLYGVARLRDGVSIEAASANVAAIASQLEQQYPDSNRGQGSAIVPLADVIVGAFGRASRADCGGWTAAAPRGRQRRESVAGQVGKPAPRNRGSDSARRVVRPRPELSSSPRALCWLRRRQSLATVLAYCDHGPLTKMIPANIAARMPYLQDLGANLRVAAFRRCDCRWSPSFFWPAPRH